MPQLLGFNFQKSKFTYRNNMTTPKQKPTPEQKALAKAVKAQAQANARMKQEFEAAEALAKFKIGLPKRLMDAQALAYQLGVQVDVGLTETGPSVYFRNREDPHIDSELTYESSEWEVERMERALREIKDEQDARVARREKAQSVWNNLAVDQKACLKEFIHSLY